MPKKLHFQFPTLATAELEVLHRQEIIRVDLIGGSGFGNEAASLRVAYWLRSNGYQNWIEIVYADKRLPKLKELLGLQNDLDLPAVFKSENYKIYFVPASLFNSDEASAKIKYTNFGIAGFAHANHCKELKTKVFIGMLPYLWNDRNRTMTYDGSVEEIRTKIWRLGSEEPSIQENSETLAIRQEIPTLNEALLLLNKLINKPKNQLPEWLPGMVQRIQNDNFLVMPVYGITARNHAHNALLMLLMGMKHAQDISDKFSQKPKLILAMQKFDRGEGLEEFQDIIKQIQATRKYNSRAFNPKLLPTDVRFITVNSPTSYVEKILADITANTIIIAKTGPLPAPIFKSLYTSGDILAVQEGPGSAYDLLNAQKSFLRCRKSSLDMPWGEIALAQASPRLQNALIRTYEFLCIDGNDRQAMRDLATAIEHNSHQLLGELMVESLGHNSELNTFFRERSIQSLETDRLTLGFREAIAIMRKYDLEITVRPPTYNSTFTLGNEIELLGFPVIPHKVTENSDNQNHALTRLPPGGLTGVPFSMEPPKSGLVGEPPREGRKQLELGELPHVGRQTSGALPRYSKWFYPEFIRGIGEYVATFFATDNWQSRAAAVSHSATESKLTDKSSQTQLVLADNPTCDFSYHSGAQGESYFYPYYTFNFIQTDGSSFNISIPMNSTRIGITAEGMPYLSIHENSFFDAYVSPKLSSSTELVPYNPTVRYSYPQERYKVDQCVGIDGRVVCVGESTVLEFTPKHTATEEFVASFASKIALLAVTAKIAKDAWEVVYNFSSEAYNWLSKVGQKKEAEVKELVDPKLFKQAIAKFIDYESKLENRVLKKIDELSAKGQATSYREMLASLLKNVQTAKAEIADLKKANEATQAELDQVKNRLLGSYEALKLLKQLRLLEEEINAFKNELQQLTIPIQFIYFKKSQLAEIDSLLFALDEHKYSLNQILEKGTLSELTDLNGDIKYFRNKYLDWQNEFARFSAAVVTESKSVGDFKDEAAATAAFLQSHTQTLMKLGTLALPPRTGVTSGQNLVPEDATSLNRTVAPKLALK